MIGAFLIGMVIGAALATWQHQRLVGLYDRIIKRR